MQKKGNKVQLRFSKIKNGNIFKSGFEDLQTSGNGVIEFKRMQKGNCGIVVIYAPNGVGKSSFAEVLKNETGSDNISFEATDEAGNSIIPSSKAFHVIADQINRNIIPGKTNDYLIGADIQREYRLRDSVDSGFVTAYEKISNFLKTDYKVTKKGDYWVKNLQTRNEEAYGYIQDIVNKQHKGKGINRNDYIGYVRNPANRPVLPDVDAEKKSFMINNSSIVQDLLTFDYSLIRADIGVAQIEKNDDAIGILSKYKHLYTCIVCDNEEIDSGALLAQKTEGRKQLYERLDDGSKKLLDNVAGNPALQSNDPFGIKPVVMNFMSTGATDEFLRLREEMRFYANYIADEMIVLLMDCFDGTNLIREFDELKALRETQPHIEEEELLFIKEIINDNLDGRSISLSRNPENNNNFELLFDDRLLPGATTKDLHLSAGEQNFISLTFELLLAKNSDCEYIVLDDPISSFDSVYKNKIAYCIIKFLECKKQIILTHNTDLIRLLEVQLNNCFNLYIMNNTENGVNGFIPVNTKEQSILINLSKLVNLFQGKKEDLNSLIVDKRLFLISMIPFMRGYAHICKDDDDNYVKLSKVMHGYGTDSVDAAHIYKELFGYEITASEIVSVSDVLELNFDNITIFDSNSFPLLSETLIQTLTYYYLRMKVEKELVDIFKICINKQDPLTLSQIIQKAFCCNPKDADFSRKRSYRVFFASRKTLLNEFNHFEGNMNIFQPAIDIDRAALHKEFEDILNKLEEIRGIYGIS